MQIARKKIKGYRYLIDELGRVRSLHTGKYLKPTASSNGYLTVKLSRNGICKTFHIHRIIGEYFLHKPEGSQCINHKDGDKTNNSVGNLEWVTYSENIKHSYDKGLSKTNGINHHSNRLTELDVLEIWEKLKNFDYKDIAKEYGVSLGCIQGIKHKRKWKRILQGVN